MDEQKRTRRLRTVGLAGLALLILIVTLRERGLILVSPLPASSPDASPAVDGNALEASGIIQVEEVSVASEFGGRVVEIRVAEGHKVTSGDVLVRLDTTLLDAQIEAARAAVAWAEAGLAQAQAGARAGQIAVAEAQLAQAKTAHAAATQAVSDTLALVENPQDIRLQIAVTQAQAEAAQYHVARAVTLKDAAEVAKNEFEEAKAHLDESGGEGRRKVLIASGSLSELPAEIADQIPELIDGVYSFKNLELHIHDGSYELYKWVNVSLPLEFHLTPNQWWQAWVGVNAATAQQEGIQTALAHLYTQQAHPQSLEVKADEALTALAQAEAKIAAAQAQVDGLRAGASQEQIAALEARVAQAQATLDSLLTQRAMLAVVAPLDGTVVDLMLQPGEVARPGAALLTLADLAELQLVVYLPETQIGRVRLGQSVRVAVDSFPDRVFEGQVTHVADRAEFTPRNVATKEERVNLVFAVQIRLPNDDGALKAGMPADALFEE